jgi:hypothetical protein
VSIHRDFKVGDNLVRNADALCELSDCNENGTFNKLMVIQAGSIVEAALHEIMYRAQQCEIINHATYFRACRRSSESPARTRSMWAPSWSANRCSNCQPDRQFDQRHNYCNAENTELPENKLCLLGDADFYIAPPEHTEM